MATVTRLAYSDTPGSPTTRTVLTIPSAQPIGTYLVAIVCSSGGGSTFTLADSKSNTWTQRQYASNSSSPSSVIAIYTTPDAGIGTALTTSDTLTLTSTAGSGAGDILLIKVVPDVSGTLAYHTGGAGTGSSNTPACTSFTGTAGDLIISGLSESHATLNTATTAGAGFTKLAGIDAHTQSRSCVGQYGGAPTASITAPYTMSSTQQYATVAIAITETVPPPAAFEGECARGVYDSTTTKTINIPITNAVAAGQSIVMGVEMAAGTPNTGMTVTDSKGNTWALADVVAQNGVGSNGQGFIIYCSALTTGLTTSDHVTVTVTSGSGGTGNTQWCWVGVAYSGLLAFDKAAHNNGASSQNYNTGTTGAAAQNRQMVFGIFVGTGTGVSMTTISPTDFTALTPQTTTTVVRNLWVIWGLVNISGTRLITAHPSDATSHAWAGVIAAFNSNAPVANTVQWHLPDALGTGWSDGELVLAVGSGWDS